jgi:hypothetical protein
VNEERMYKVILGAHISEKATVIADESNQVRSKGICAVQVASPAGRRRMSVWLKVMRSISQTPR